VLEPSVHAPPAWHVVPIAVQSWQRAPAAPQAVSPRPATHTPRTSQQPMHDGPQATPPPLLATASASLLPLPPLFAPLLLPLLPDDDSGDPDEPTSPEPTSPARPPSSVGNRKLVPSPALAHAQRPASPTRTARPLTGPMLDIQINCLPPTFAHAGAVSGKSTAAPQESGSLISSKRRNADEVRREANALGGRAAAIDRGRAGSPVAGA
jgi:hypothetical protein